VGIEGYTRYESEDAGLEEQTLLLTLVTECVGYGIGGSWIKGDDYGDGEEGEDDFRISFQLWLTAFPRAVMDMGGR
jgi:hypothetical protein